MLAAGSDGKPVVSWPWGQPAWAARRQALRERGEALRGRLQAAGVLVAEGGGG